MNIEFLVGEKKYTVAVEEKKGEFFVTCGESKKKVLCKSLSPNIFVLEIDGRSRLVHIAENADCKYVRLAGKEIRLEKPRQEQASKAADAGSGIGEDGIVETPMPGKIVKISVEENQKVEKGATLMVVESMKMENAIHAPWKALVKKIHVAEGDQTQLGQPLMEIEKNEE